MPIQQIGRKMALLRDMLFFITGGKWNIEIGESFLDTILF
jgi:hypothetical protein